ncbi:LysR substrate-binding domain-containing protein [Pigmentiphaga litoralis]|uniref:LysR substrate-binding domain-containing protein n=1 Tax=Pigmentiphaga litoralis TaxID=516702 RepID=UPI003B43A44A
MKRANDVRRKIPSPMMLQAFEASARSLSFTDAAKTLNLTQSAISHQILGLEQYLGVQLFERVRKRLRLTQAGQSFLSTLTPALDALETALRDAMATQPLPRCLRLGVVPTVAAAWLIPRMGDFYAKHPDVTLELVTRLPFNFTNNSLDAAINLGNARWPGAVADYLMDEEMLVVCQPAMAATVLKQASDLARVTLLHLSLRPHAWHDWAAVAGVDLPDASAGPRFELHAMVSQAAAAGLGAAVLPRFLILDELASGKLVSPFGPVVTSAMPYYLVYPPANRTLPVLLQFRAWLREQAAETGITPTAVPPSIGATPAAPCPARGGRSA